MGNLPFPCSRSGTWEIKLNSHNLPGYNLNSFPPQKNFNEQAIYTCSGKLHPSHQWHQFHLLQTIYLVTETRAKRMRLTPWFSCFGLPWKRVIQNMFPLTCRTHELGLVTSLVSSPNPQEAGKPILCFPCSFEAGLAFHLLLLQCI